MAIEIEDLKLTFVEWLDLKETSIVDVVCGQSSQTNLTQILSIYIGRRTIHGKDGILRA